MMPQAVAGGAAHCQHRRRRSRAFSWLAMALLAGCSTPKPEPARPAPPPPPAGHQPAPGAAINQDLSAIEAAWHLRAAMNVAALSCGSHAGDAMVTGYNRFLSAQKSPLAEAYAAEQSRYPGRQRELDGHMTRLYNYFAWPPAQQQFCAAAMQAAPQMATMSAAQFKAEAPAMLARLDGALAAQPAMARAAAPLAAKAAAVPLAAKAAAAPAGLPEWRIQLGAFTGEPAARAAWSSISARSAEIAAHTPRFQPVPGRAPLVRLQLDGRISRAEAVRLCALAAASGFDCFPVAG